MRALRPILLTSFFFSLHGALVAYVNSSMLGEHLTPKGVSIIYTLSALLSLLLVARAAKWIKRFGNVAYVAGVLTSAAVLLFGIGITSNHWFSVVLFIPYFALNTLVYYGLDVFLEHFSDPKHTGNNRGVFLTLNNIAWVGMPAFVGLLESRYGFAVVYFFAACAVLAALSVMIVGERGYHDSRYAPVSLKRMIRVLATPGNIRGAIIINGILQLFYVWMVIYTPLYLINTLGFGWDTVGIIFSVMLIPFIVFQYPAGRIADRFSNERELIAGGLLIAGVATMLFALVGTVNAFAIALILLLTRVGISIVEVANESYFFKQVTDADTSTIAVYRNMSPLAYLVGPLLGVLLLGWNIYSVLFFILGVIVIAGAVFAMTLKDLSVSGK